MTAACFYPLATLVLSQWQTPCSTIQVVTVMAPCKSVGFADMAIFWVAFYYAMFQQDTAKMSNIRIEETGTAAARLFNMHMKLFMKKKGVIKSIDLK
jgi:hypothetical protein